MSPSWCEELLVVTLNFSECIPTNMWTGPGVALAAMARAAAGSAGPEPVWLSMQYTPHLSISLIFFRHQPYCAWLVRCIKGLSALQFSHKKTTAQSAWDNFFHDAAFNRLSSGASPQDSLWPIGPPGASGLPQLFCTGHNTSMAQVTLRQLIMP